MRLTRTFMLERARARDSRYDDRFLTGVLSTGIYCLPSCPARPPKEENIRFFRDEGTARHAGLRPCLRCRPDDFLRGHDPDLELVRELTAEVRRRPEDFPDLESVRRRFSVGSSRLHTLFRRHMQQTPLAYLNRQRLEAAAERLLTGDESVLDVAFGVGFDSPSAFHDNFRRAFFQCPGDYRRSCETREFVLDLPRNWLLRRSFDLLARDVDSPTDHRRGDTLTRALLIGRKGVTLKVTLAPGALCASVESSTPLSVREMTSVHRTTRRMLGLTQEPRAFERLAGRTEVGRRLIAGRRGLLSPQWPTAFEALTWSIIGQQVNLTFAATMRRRLIELCGRPVGALHCHPTPRQVARLDPSDLTRRQFSRRKAEYLIGLARTVVRGRLQLGKLRTEPATWVERHLLGQRGLGPWSVHYAMLRGLAFADCVPLGDVGLTEGLRRLYDLEERPGRDQTLDLLQPFAPFRSFATLHIWSTLLDGEPLGERR